MDDVRSATESLLADKPALEGDLQAVLSVDADADGWTFDDVPLDSGTFGELVSRGVVAKDDDGDYRVADRTAVRAALDGEDAAVAADAGFSTPSLSLPAVDRNAALALAGALLLVVAMRSFPIPSVFRGDAVVLSSNDPYYYRYWVEHLLAQSGGGLHFGVLSDMGRMADGEPLMVATLWFVSALLGGGKHITGVVLAVYPVVAALVAAVLLYLLAVRLTGDRRVGLAAVVMLAVTPDHALRTAVGFADHHAFDYPWLLLTAYGLVGALDAPDLRNGEGWLATAALGIGLAGQVLAWEASPLLILPVGFVVAGSALALVAQGEDVVDAHFPVIAGTGVAAGTVGLVHVVVHWHTSVVAATPALLFAGVVGVSLVGEAFVRADLAPRHAVGTLVGLSAIIAGAVVTVGFVFVPEFGPTVTEGLKFLFSRASAAETESLFQSDLGLFVAPVFSFGLGLFLALPYLVWTSWNAVQSRYRRWFVPLIYCWWFLALATVQLRFTGELAAFAALFAGLGFVHLAAVVDLSDRRPDVLAGGGTTSAGTAPGGDRATFPLPDATTLRYAIILLLLVAGVGALFTPLKIGLTTVDGAEHTTATAINGYATENNVEYPESYVLSRWDRNRMYNYFVNGESKSNWFAVVTYDSFLTETDGQQAYEMLTYRKGFVVTTDSSVPANSEAVGYRLHEHDGSANGSANGLGHYRLVHVGGGGSIKAFEVVPGARLRGTTDPGTVVSVTTEVSVEGRQFTYERTATAGADGRYSVRVPYAGEYQVGDSRVTVSEADVRGNESIPVQATPENVNSGDSVTRPAGEPYSLYILHRVS